MLIEFFGQTVSSAKCHSLITLLFPGTSQNSPTAGWSGSLASVEACNELKREGEVEDGRDRGGGERGFGWET